MLDIVMRCNVSCLSFTIAVNSFEEGSPLEGLHWGRLIETHGLEDLIIIVSATILDLFTLGMKLIK